jgi:hypothetical protein
MQSEKQLCLSAWGKRCMWLRERMLTGVHYSKDASLTLPNEWFIAQVIWWRKEYFQHIGIFL